MKTATLTLAALLALTIVGLALWRAEQSSDRAGLPATPATAAPAPQPNYRSQLANATDYRTFMLATLDAARAGNADAQYALYQALAYCNDRDRYFRQGPGKRMTLEQALAAVIPDAPEDQDEVRRAAMRCAPLWDQPLQDAGTAQDWLTKATAAGHPLALLKEATAELKQADLDFLSVAMRKNANDTGNAHRRAAIALAQRALRSKDPDVLWTLGALAGTLGNQSGAGDTGQWISRLAACLRGYDCGEHAPWSEGLCRLEHGMLCRPGETATDVIRRVSGDAFPEVQRRASEINDQLNRNDWRSLDTALEGKGATQSNGAR